MTKEDFYNNEKFKATDFMEYKHDVWEFFRRYIYQIKEDKLNVTSIKVDRPLYEDLKEMKKTFCMFVEHTEEPVSIFGIKLEIKDELEELKEHCDELELINQKVMEENKVFKDREDGFKKQIIGLCEKYHQVYERFPELKDAFLQGDRIMQENEQIKEYNADLKQSLDWANERETEWSNRIEELKTDLEYAKAIIKDLLNNSHEYARQNAEQFIKGEKK